MSGRIVFEHDSPNGQITVTDVGQLRTLKLGVQKQSSMYLDSPFDTDFDFPGYFHLALAINPAIERVLAIGLGGGTMVKRMWRDYPQMHLDAVELDPDVVDVARRFFALPDDKRIAVETGDGRAFLESSSAVWDLIVVDAFDGERVPRHLTTEEFCREARAHLDALGVLAYNFHGSVAGDRSKPFRSLHRTLANVFSRLWVFPIGLADGGAPGAHREIIIFATDAETTAEVLLARVADRVAGRVSIPGYHRFGDDLYCEAVRTGDVSLILDPPGTR